jgi:FK506-binding protein 2
VCDWVWFNKKKKGIEDGIDGMCAGEVRRLLIPANQGKQSHRFILSLYSSWSLAYGDLGLPNLVPRKCLTLFFLKKKTYKTTANSAIVVDVEMVEVISQFS